jgi:hypothetical protein
MATKQLKQPKAAERDLRDVEVADWEEANRKRLKADLAEAEADIARGDVEELDLQRYLAEARRRARARKR